MRFALDMFAYANSIYLPFGKFDMPLRGEVGREAARVAARGEDIPREDIRVFFLDKRENI